MIKYIAVIIFFASTILLTNYLFLEATKTASVPVIKGVVHG